MEYLVTKTIPREELTEYKDYINFLFKNEDGVYNICRNEEDVQKSNMWFQNFPLKSIIVSTDSIEVGDKFLAICNNSDLNGKVFKYLGPAEEGEGLIKISSKDKESFSTEYLLQDSYKFVRMSSLDDREKLINRKITQISL